MAENTTAVLTVTASDDDDSIARATRSKAVPTRLQFEIGVSTGALSFKAAPNFEDAQDEASTDPVNDAG